MKKLVAILAVLGAAFGASAQSLKFNEVCVAGLVASCAANVKQYQRSSSNQPCPPEWGQNTTGGALGMPVVHWCTPPSRLPATEYTRCEHQVRGAEAEKYVKQEPSCVVVDDVTNQLNTLKTTLTTDMRSLLSQFCRTYAADPKKCEEIRP